MFCTNTRVRLACLVSSTLMLAGVPSAIAQEQQEQQESQRQQQEQEQPEQAEETPPAEEVPEFKEEIVVTGSRAGGRSVTESMVPIDVMSSDEFLNQGETDLSNLLRTVAPSWNVNSQPISDAATLVRPPNLRNLAPDHTLVLVNNKRRHRAAIITWIGNGVADGSQGPDIAQIPAIALKQVEVLRDGASAQYGSDAIAGVLNLLLRDEPSRGTVETRFGKYADGDGDTVYGAANFGVGWGDGGFGNFSVELGQSDPTSRSVQRDDAAAVIAAGNTNVRDPAQIWGLPEVDDDLKLFANFANPFGGAGGSQFYGHANYGSKKVTGGFYFRNPNTRSGVFSPDGGETLLVGDLLDARDGVLDGSARCPVVRITNNVPDPVALARVKADPNCFSFQEIFPGGFTPQFVIEEAQRNARFPTSDFLKLDLIQPLDPVELKRQWLASVRRALEWFPRLPPEDVGCLYLDAQNRPVTPDPESPEFPRIHRHFGSVRGAWPVIRE